MRAKVIDAEEMEGGVRGERTFALILGDIALKDGEPTVHAHVVVGKPDGTAHGGHLIEAHVRPTLEMILVESPNFLRRTIDPETGLALINIGAPEKNKRMKIMKTTKTGR